MKTDTHNTEANGGLKAPGKVKLICMSFDGEYQTERPTFESIDEAWNYANDLGSKWFFYPFHFVVTASGKTIKDAPEPLNWLNGQRVKQVSAIFGQYAKRQEAEGMDAENFAFYVGSD